jgi:branched-chain amino acid transport system ATP-binding protein
MRVPLLELEDVEARYGAVKALNGVTLEVGERQVVSILGANGAGKTTTLRAISGTVRRSGGLRFEGKPLPSSPEAVARLGIAHVPEGRGTFAELSVDENLKLGAYTRRDRRGYARDHEELLEHFPWLAERGDQQAGTLSGGEQQMLALARAFMAHPRLILVDEPSLGLAPLIVKQLFDVLRGWVEEHGMSALVVEQNANVALEHSERGYVLEVGRVVVEGTADELRGNESVRKSYLGY